MNIQKLFVLFFTLILHTSLRSSVFNLPKDASSLMDGSLFLGASNNFIEYSDLNLSPFQEEKKVSSKLPPPKKVRKRNLVLISS